MLNKIEQVFDRFDGSKEAYNEVIKLILEVGFNSESIDKYELYHYLKMITFEEECENCCDKINPKEITLKAKNVNPETNFHYKNRQTEPDLTKGIEDAIIKILVPKRVRELGPQSLMPKEN